MFETKNIDLGGKCNKPDGTCREWHIPLCRYFKSGKCFAKEGQCIYLHEDPKVKPALAAKVTKAKKKDRKLTRKTLVNKIYKL